MLLALNDDVLGGPLLVEGGEAAMLADAHDMLPEVKLLGVEAQQAEPQLPDRLRVLSVMWPSTGLHSSYVVIDGLSLRKFQIDSNGKTVKISPVFLSHQRSKRSSHRPAPPVSSFHRKSAIN